MKSILNIIIVCLIYLVYLDVENNSNSKELNYSNTILCVFGIAFFVILRIYSKEFVSKLNNL